MKENKTPSNSGWKPVPEPGGTDYAFPDQWAQTSDDFLERAHREADLMERQDRIVERTKFTDFLKRFFSIWFVFCAIVVVLAGMGWLKLPELALVTLIGTTTANVIGLMAIMARYLYHHEKKR